MSTSLTKNKYTRIISCVIVILYALIPLYFFAHMVHMDDSHMATMQDCPYSIGQYSVCPLDFAGHLTLWQSLTLVSIPSALILSVLSIALYFSVVNISLLIQKRLLYVRQKLRITFFCLFKELFSQGILNTKVY